MPTNKIFRTTLEPIPSMTPIQHPDGLLLMGSCFTEHMGQKLAAYKFLVQHNPFGIVYNPISIARCITRLNAENQYFTRGELFEHQGLWHSWEHHSRFSGPDAASVLINLNAAYQAAVAHLKKARFLFLTLGTADVHERLDSGQIVANNHKVPAAKFQTRLLSVSEITDRLVAALQALGDVRVILTVSPVRHLRAGLVENQRSKATLVLACAEICRQMPTVQYFPAYEWMLDDLRDYRFYAEDMIHPSALAVDYIWSQFSDTYFGAETKFWMEKIEKIQLAVQHRPFHPDTPQHQAFKQAQLLAIEEVQKALPHTDFSIEKAYFSR